jgi:WD40 repeat protein
VLLNGFTFQPHCEIPHPHRSAISHIASSPCGTRFAIVSEDGLLSVWSNALEMVQYVADVHFGLPVHAVVYSSDGMLIYTGGEDGSVCLCFEWPIASRSFIEASLLLSVAASLRA